MTIVAVLICVASVAQRRIVVIDMESKVPVRDVKVKFRAEFEEKTMWDGSFTADSLFALLYREEADSVEGRDVLSQRERSYVRMSKAGYVTLMLEREELTDTVELLPSYNRLAEVVVYGVNRQRTMSFVLKPMSETDRGLMTSGNKNGGVSISVDIMGGIEKLATYKRRKRIAKARKGLEKY